MTSDQSVWAIWFPQRIDLYLVATYGYSRNFFHHLIERGAVLVNGKPTKKSYQLKHPDTVEILSMERFLDGGILAEAPAVELDVRLEKDDYLVLYKPKGMLSHPNSVWEVGEPSVVGALYHRYKDLPSQANFVRAGLLHRLDKWTDGFMIIAKTETWLAYFKELFQQKSQAPSVEAKEKIPLKKYYRATCEMTDQGRVFLGCITEFPYLIQELVIPKTPHPGEHKMGITKILAVSNVPDIAENLLRDAHGRVSLELEILTGRTHQIRYHLASKGLPVVGDYLYGEDTGEELQLTAWKLEFIDMEGEKVCVSD